MAAPIKKQLLDPILNLAVQKEKDINFAAGKSILQLHKMEKIDTD